MKKLRFISVGKTTKPFIKHGVEEYKKRLPYEVSEVEIGERPTVKKECDEILDRIKGYTVLLDISGKITSSEDFAQLIGGALESADTLTFVIGGSDGVDDRVRTAASARVSFGRITLPHQLCKLILFEQVYRAYTILHRLPYHK